MNPLVSLRFLGGAQTVTGSKYLLTFQEKKVLIDCGLFQGLKELRIKNWDRFPIAPNEIDALLLTHAHIDHSGYIPRLVKEGFRGAIYCSQATAELCRIMLLDSAHLQEEEAEWLNKRKISKHNPALPLYTAEDVEKTLDLFRPQNFGAIFDVAPGFKCVLSKAGHILGAAFLSVEVNQQRIAFSGDIGRPQDDILLPPENLPPDVDYLVVESTYGNRLHQVSNAKEELRKIIIDSIKNKSVILIPAFTVGRTQTLMHFLSELRKEGSIPTIPMYLNSPMATSANSIFCNHTDLHKITIQQCNRMNDDFEYIKSVEESKLLNEKKGPMIIIAGSGMATGGRILHHLEAFASDAKNIIVLSGFQAAGTRGRSLQDGAKEIKIHGRMIPVNAQVKMIENLSAHADYAEIIDWLKKSNLRAKKVFVTHGEPESITAMKGHIEAELQIPCETPHQDQEYVL